MKQGYNPKTGARIKGTYEMMPCCYFIAGFEADEDGKMYASGIGEQGTEDYYEGVEQVERNGQLIYVDEAGDLVPFNEIEFRDDGEDDDE